MTDDQTQPETDEPTTDIAGVPEPVEESAPPAPTQVDLSGITLTIGNTDPVDAVAKVNDLVRQSCGKFAMRDEVHFACGVAMMPTPDQGPIPVISLTVAIPSMVLAQRLQGTVMLQDLFPPAEMIDGIVKEVLENLRQARMGQMAESAAAAGLANGFPKV